MAFPFQTDERLVSVYEVYASCRHQWLARQAPALAPLFSGTCPLCAGTDVRLSSVKRPGKLEIRFSVHCCECHLDVHVDVVVPVGTPF